MYVCVCVSVCVCVPVKTFWGGCGEGNGTALQYSCLENPMDGGAWQAAVHGVAKSQIRLKRLSSSSGQGKRSPFCIVRPLSKYSLFQDTVANLSSGPKPPFFEELMSPLIPNIVDRAPEGTTFGDVLLPANTIYRVVRLGKGCWDPYEAYT